jgi:hypothetical protein
MDENNTNNQQQSQADGGQQNNSQQQSQQAGTQQQSQQAAGDKTYTQAELDKIVQERLARAKVAGAQAPATTPEQTATNPAAAVDNSALEAQIAVMQAAMLTSEVKAAMAINGIQPEKVERGVRLIDTTKCVDDKGMPDQAKIKAEIDAMVKDFPEMKASSGDSASGFRIGADGNTAVKPDQADAISSIFGNKKG